MTSLIVPQKDKSLNQAYLLEYKSGVLQTWHHHCSSKKAQDGTRCAVAMVTVLPQRLISINTDIPSLFLTKGDSLPTS